MDVASALADATDHLVEASPFQPMVELLDFAMSFLSLLCFDQLTLESLTDEVDPVALSFFGSCIILERHAHSRDFVVDRLPRRGVSVQRSVLFGIDALCSTRHERDLALPLSTLREDCPLLVRVQNSRVVVGECDFVM